jgi:hypothetical protein
VDDNDNISLDKGADTSIDLDSSYSSDRTDVSIKECDKEPAQQKCDALELNEFREAT